MTVSTHVFDATELNFEAEVIRASLTTPVLVDFWAAWCGPCKSLTPILEKVVASYNGAVRLAKVDTDAEMQLAAAFGVRSLPTVVLFKDRTVVDHFIGVVPESQIREMLEKHLPKTVDSPLQRAQQLKAAGDFAGARKIIENELARDRENIDLQTSLAELQALDGDVDGARKELERLQGSNPTHPSVKRLAALLAFSDVVAAYPDVRSLRERAAANPTDLELKHALAVHQLLGGDVEPALLSWLEMLRDHRTYKEDLARHSLVMAFELIGEADPIVNQTRRAMARMLF